MAAAPALQTSPGAVLAGFFEVQLDFARAMGARLSLPLGTAVTRYTNLHKRFGLGTADEADPHPLWQGYLDALAALADAQAQVDLTVRTYDTAPHDAIPPGQTRFGCFGVEAPDAEGRVRIHFGNRDSADGIGPLDRRKLDRRMAELAALVTHVRENHPDARTIKGRSWLYNLEAYRRLLPAEFVAGRRFVVADVQLSGMSFWGQMIDHTGAVRPRSLDYFQARLDSVDIEAPWEVFPLKALSTEAPFALFCDHIAAG